jgi:hypothetical protein
MFKFKTTLWLKYIGFKKAVGAVKFHAQNTIIGTTSIAVLIEDYNNKIIVAKMRAIDGVI